MPVRPYKLVGTSLLATLGEGLGALASEWARDWDLPEAAVTAEAMRACDATDLPGAWRMAGGHAGRSLRLDWDARFIDALGAAMFAIAPGSHAGAGSMVEQAAVEASADLAKRLMAPVAHDPAALTQPAPLQAPSALFTHGAGAVVVEVRCGAAAMRCLFDGELVAMLAPDRPATLPALAKWDVRRVAAHLPAAVTLEAGQAKVALGGLAALAVGDVIRLDSALERPLKVSGAQGVHLCDGYLGSQDGQYAIEIIRDTT